MNLNDLLLSSGIDPSTVLVLRHRPWETELRKVLPWLAAEKPDVFNAYQQAQGESVEKAMQGLIGRGYIASFIGHQPGKALFVGLYSIGKATPRTRAEYWKVPENIELKKRGMAGFSKKDARHSVLWFDLKLTDIFAAWKGRLVVDWPPPERSWWRRAARNVIPIHAILEQSALDAAMPEWDQLVLSWDELKLIPTPWRLALAQWRAIYYMLDVSDGKGYVGAAYGEENLFGRWSDYAARGHGGNKLLKKRDPKNLRFSILQRLSPDMQASEVTRLEASWKERLHTRAPLGLNDN